MISIDGQTFNVGTMKVVRKPSIDKIPLGTTLDGTKHYLNKGVYYDYEITISTRNMNVSEYDALYELITTPANSHVVSVPYNQTTITFNAFLSVSNDTLLQSYTNFKRWGTLTIIAEALEYAKEATE